MRAFCTALAFALFPTIYAMDTQMIQDQNTLEIKTLSLAKRQTAKLRLENGLEAFVISDPEATRSAAALAVNVGSWFDPEDQPGLAHFCEHMLFLGTSRYPVESEYDRYLSENAGTMNAYTAHDHTNYMFAVKHEAFEEALDRFSWFFKEPLFNESGVDREVQAIDQEYAKNVPQDHIREIYIAKSLANPKHPHSRFNMGNQESLVNATPEILREWYEHHYSSHLMHLVIYSSLPLDQLTTMVEGQFADVPRREVEAFATEEPLFDPDTKNQVVYYTPLKDLRTLSFTWELPGEFARMLDRRPELVVGFILGHEGEESLLAQLKKEELVEGLSAGGYQLGGNNFVFRLKVSLTDKGIRRTDDIIYRVYQAIDHLQANPPAEYIFDEVQRMATISYEYQSREDAFEYVSAHSREMLYEALETYPMLSSVPQKYDAAAVKRLISHLTQDRCQLTITAKPQLTGVKPDRHERWVGGDYALATVNDKLLAKLREVTPLDNFAVSPPNPFIPENLDIIGSREEYKGVPKPVQIASDDRGTVYFGADQHYLVPEVVWTFKIKSSEFPRGDADKAVLADLFARSVTEELNSLSYTASVAGLHFQIAAAPDGIVISIQGYSEKAPELFKEILARLKSIRPTEQQFRIYRNSLRRSYENFRKESPFAQGYHELKGIIYDDFVKTPDKARVVRGVTYEEFLAFTGKLFKETYTEGVLYGNMTEAAATEAWERLTNTLGSEPFAKKFHTQRKVVMLPEEHGPYFYTHRIKEPGNAVILMVQNGEFDFQKRAIQQILSKGIQQPFYSELRTKQQTGYIVHSWASEIEKQLFSFFTVQSNTHDGRDLLSRFELVIERFLQEMEQGDLDEERFENIRDSFITQLEQPPRNINEMAALLNLLAFEYEGDFDWMKKRISGFHQLNYPVFTGYAKEFLGRDNHRRLGLLVSGEIPEENRFTYSNVKNARKMRKLSEYIEKPVLCPETKAGT